MDAKRAIQVLGAMACVSFGLAAVQLAGAQGAKREVRALRASLLQAQSRLEGLPSGEIVSELRDVVAVLPHVEAGDVDRGGVHVWLSSTLREAGLRSQSITTLEPSEVDGVTVRSMSVECVGGFHGIQAFVHALDVSALPIRMDRLQLSQLQDGTGELLARMDLSTTDSEGGR